MDQLTHELSTNLAAVVIILAGFALATVVLCLVLYVRLRRVEKLWAQVAQEATTDGGGVILHVASRTESLVQRMEDAETRIANLDRVVSGCAQHIGLVRYDAFEDVGGRQSFSLAILDGRHSGVLISAIYSRTDVRLYAKLMDHGRPSVPLTPEETSAVTQALTGTTGG